MFKNYLLIIKIYNEGVKIFEGFYKGKRPMSYKNHESLLNYGRIDLLFKGEKAPEELVVWTREKYYEAYKEEFHLRSQLDCLSFENKMYKEEYEILKNALIKKDVESKSQAFNIILDHEKMEKKKDTLSGWLKEVVFKKKSRAELRLDESYNLQMHQEIKAYKEYNLRQLEEMEAKKELKRVISKN